MRQILGTMYFGTKTDRQTSYALLDRYVEAGGRVLDTANCYSFWAHPSGRGGQSETLIGEWLGQNQGLRPELTIATKVGVEPVDGGGVEGLGADVIKREAARSLERLQVDKIDVYFAHGEDRETDFDETLCAFNELADERIISRLGFSNHPTWRIEQARGWARAHGGLEPSALQLTTSYVEPRPGAAVDGKGHRFGFVSDETIDYLERRDGVELWAYSPLIQGAYDRADRPLSSAYEHPGTTARLAALAQVAEQTGHKPGQVVLAWLIRRGIRPVIGVSSVAQLDEAIAAEALELTEAQVAVLDAPQ